MSEQDGVHQEVQEVQRIGGAPSSLRVGLTGRGARRWYAGGLVGLAWLVNAGFDIFGAVPSTTDRVVVVALLIAYGAAYLVIPPLNWSVAARYRLLLPLGLLALSFAFVPWLGFDVYALWVYVGVVAAMSLLEFRVILGLVIVLTGVAVWFASLAGETGDQLFYLPAIIASVSLMMAAFARVINAMNQLRATQHELARLAVDTERTRVARDLHDILGHSLTVITVKAELAGRLVESDPVRAAREIGEVEDLARGALADVRSTVSGFREVSIASELAAARSALGSAGISAQLPGSVDDVPSDYREPFGWAVREGVTNVLRHSRATSYTITLGADFVEVRDDGATTGSALGTGQGSGLAGLRDRMGAAGLRVEAEPVKSGGFRLRVSA
ncbi:sensor histidine kinase [Naasia lichenicola]|uniref:Sensor histidine kinase n=1 Tax=Naasia lichenicola TaxID=2565933 RepID=A0A4S4FSE6_9MICO|nr:sensor histidine kinase [Naasia lichenicola]THG33324.1 sensor histidine kinase [Naasia lichenicola]